jgi:hypothetical protein
MDGLDRNQDLHMRFASRAPVVRCSIVLFIASLGAGCQLFGLAGRVLPDPTVAPKYKGLQNQNTAVMIWMDRSMAIDWPRLQLDLSRGIEGRLADMAKEKKPPKDLTGTTFAAAESVVRYQRDHPEIDTEAITEVAPRMNVTRLIYVELQHFSTRPEESVELFRGSIKANLKVIEVQNGKGKVTYEEDDIKVDYPTDSPDVGLPGLGDVPMYEKTLETFSTEIMNRFVEHTEELKTT